jgi:hypothetical protein
MKMPPDFGQRRTPRPNKKYWKHVRRINAMQWRGSIAQDVPLDNLPLHQGEHGADMGVTPGYSEMIHDRAALEALAVSELRTDDPLFDGFGDDFFHYRGVIDLRRNSTRREFADVLTQP